jgi:hypothetical protein
MRYQEIVEAVLMPGGLVVGERRISTQVCQKLSYERLPKTKRLMGSNPN